MLTAATALAIGPSDDVGRGAVLAYICDDISGGIGSLQSLVHISVYDEHCGCLACAAGAVGGHREGNTLRPREAVGRDRVVAGQSEGLG